MAVVFLALDFTYIFFVGKAFSDQISNIQRVAMKFRPVGAVLCYILLLAGLYLLIISKRRSPGEAALLGAVIYGTYDLTNYATLKKWDWKFSIVDILWGTTLFWATTNITYNFS
jgi:uncharacterized membrane protein